MRIGIDARFVTRLPRRGIGNYSLHLICEMVKNFPDVDFVLYISKSDSENVLPKLPNVRIVRLVGLNYLIWEQLLLPLVVFFNRIDVLHCLGNTGPIFLLPRTKLVVSVHDVMFMRSGEDVPRPTNLYQRFGAVYRRLALRCLARTKAMFITSSQYTRNDLLGVLPSVADSRVSVVHLACDPSFAASLVEQKDTSSSDPFILALGANDPRKNTSLLIRAYLEVVSRINVPVKLVICGFSNWKASKEYELVRKANKEDMVRFSSFASDSELKDLYSRALFFVYPSLYEGFGIPVLEAFALGCPLLASNASSIPEVAGSAALYFSPRDQGALERAMVSLILDQDQRRVLREEGQRRGLLFSWSSTARATFSCYKSCMSLNERRL